MNAWVKKTLDWLYSRLGGASKEELEQMKRRLEEINGRANLLETFRDDLVEVCEELVKNIRSRSRGDVPNDCSSDSNLLRRLVELGIAEQSGDRVIVVCSWRGRIEPAELSSPSYRGKE